MSRLHVGVFLLLGSASLFSYPDEQVNNPAGIIAAPSSQQSLSIEEYKPGIHKLCWNGMQVAQSMQSGLIAAIANRPTFSGVRIDVEVIVAPDGAVSDARIIRTTDDSINSIALAAVYKLRCQALGRSIKTVYPVEFNVVDE